MSASCPELPELLELDTQPAGGDGRRRHAEACPRCRNRLALYASFLEPEEVPAGADVADAERRLAQGFDRALRSEASSPPRATTNGSPARSAGRPRAWLPLPPRAAWALAAVLLVGSIALLRPRMVGPPDTGALRGGAGSRATVGAALRLDAPVALPGGGIRLSWAAHPDAESYEVRVLGPDLAELARRETSGTSLSLAADELSAAAPGAVLGWKVTALRAGARIAASTTGTIRRP